MKTIVHSLFILFLGLSLVGCSSESPSSGSVQATDQIRVNQLGFYPDAEKVAVIVGADVDSFSVVATSSDDTVYVGRLTKEEHWSRSGEDVRRATFTEVKTPGTYRLHLDGVGTSHSFAIENGVHESLATAALKAYYYQRASTPLPKRYAGKWARPSGHADDSVLVHASAASDVRPERRVLGAPKGWYDAGDYNKYVVNSGISTYTLLALHEHEPEAAAALTPNIPERGNDLPELLDEVLWNVRWMLDMQAPDGGVYHKLTHASFSGMVMPHEATAPRYVVQKGTAAALNFAAVMAQASRLYAAYPSAVPGLADTLRTASLKAWHWARTHPDVEYDQDVINDRYDPDIETGEYGDDEFEDEFAWAAAELAVTTRTDSFLAVASPLDHAPTVPTWGTVHPLGWMTLLNHRSRVSSVVDTSALVQRYRQFADDLADARADVPYRTVMGHEQGDFIWGSNSEAANQAMMLLQAYRLTNEERYRRAALSNLDYLLGRNATTYSFVTGYGDQSPMHVHHRPSEADTVEAPVPGLLAGGPNPGQSDAQNCREAGVEYPSDRPAQSYVDHLCSYASNEVTINWNAPLVYVATVLDAEYDK